jgi:hypothetical protein
MEGPGLATAAVTSLAGPALLYDLAFLGRHLDSDDRARQRKEALA